MFSNQSFVLSCAMAAPFFLGIGNAAYSQQNAAAFFSAKFNKPIVVSSRSARRNTNLRRSVRRRSIPRQVVSYRGRHRAGTILIKTKERRLYLILPGGKAIKYGVGVGRPGFQWGGTQRISRKAEWPSWRPPKQMLRRRPDLPRFMKGGIKNPLGARALYLGSTLYRIHGSNEPGTIGQAVSSGCIRMINDDVVDLYKRVRVGTRVVVSR